VTAQLVRFLLVGVSNTALTLAAYTLLVHAGVPPVVASAIAFGAGAVNGYRLNRTWTFHTPRGGPRAGARYVAVQLAGLGLNALGVGLAVGAAGLPRLAGEALALPPASATTFLLVRGWVFGAGGTRGRPRAVPRPR
jgi:putative flippase GtrA